MLWVMILFNHVFNLFYLDHLSKIPDRHKVSAFVFKPPTLILSSFRFFDRILRRKLTKVTRLPRAMDKLVCCMDPVCLSNLPY